MYLSCLMSLKCKMNCILYLILKIPKFYREKRLAKKYYDKLFKEYCIADLSRYKENKVH